MEKQNSMSAGYITDFLFCSVIGILAIFEVLTKPGVPASWDFGAHVAPSAKLAIWLRQGVYPQEFPEFWFGYPLLTFYPPLFYVSVASASIVLGVDVYVATKIAIAISFIFGSFGAYFASRSAFDSRAPSLLAATAYTFTGYHLRNIIPQGVYPASFVYMLLPWIGAFWYLSIKRRHIRFSVVAGVLLAFSILSHLITGLLSLAFFGAVTLLLSVVDLATANLRSLAAKLASVLVIGAVSLGLSAWFLVPMSGLLPSTYLSSRVIGFADDPQFPNEPSIFIRRSLRIEELVTRLPIDFAQGAHLPWYLGIIVVGLGVAGLAIFGGRFVKNLLTRPARIGQHPDFLGFSALTFAVSIVFSTYPQLFVLPLWSLNQTVAVSMMRIQDPRRLLFLAPLGASMMGAYAVLVLLQSNVAARLKVVSDRLNLDVNLSKLVVALLIFLMILDTYSYAASPFGYHAAYPPYNSLGLDSAYRWLVSEPGRFRVVDPLAGVHSHTMPWDTLAFPGGWSLAPEYYPYSPKNFKTLNITIGLPQNFAKELGYFGVKYAVGHLSDPKTDAAGFAGTQWKTVRQFNEVYVFENPFFRPIIEMVRNPDDLDSPNTGTATINSFTPNQVTVKLSSVRSAGFLVFKFFRQSRWTAYVDGAAASLVENEWGFMALQINPGSKEVAFTYVEPDIIGKTVTFLTAAIVVAVIFLSRRLRLRSSAQRA